MAFHFLYPAPTDSSEVLTSTLRALMAPYYSAPSRAEWHPAQRTQRCLYQGNQPCRQTAARPTRSLNVRRSSIFNPQVDVRETTDAYVLQAALPGARPEDVHIQFSDNQTLVISGRIERVIEGPVEQGEEATAAPETTNTPTEPTEPGPTTGSTEAPAPEPTTAPAEKTDHNDTEEAEVDWEEVNSTQYHSPTVEDTDDEDSHSATSTPKSETSKPAAPAAPVAETKKAETKDAEKAAAPSESPAKPTETHSNDKFWISERSVGQFSRGFTFAERIDQDQVSASLNNGILTVKVAKAPKHVARTVFLF